MMNHHLPIILLIFLNIYIIETEKIPSLPPCTIFISTIGNDTSGNGSLSSPFLTLSRAMNEVNNASGNDPITFGICIENGEYGTTENLNFERPNVTVYFISIQGDGFVSSFEEVIISNNHETVQLIVLGMQFAEIDVQSVSSVEFYNSQFFDAQIISENLSLNNCSVPEGALAVYIECVECKVIGISVYGLMNPTYPAPLTISAKGLVEISGGTFEKNLVNPTNTTAIAGGIFITTVNATQTVSVEIRDVVFSNNIVTVGKDFSGPISPALLIYRPKNSASYSQINLENLEFSCNNFSDTNQSPQNAPLLLWPLQLFAVSNVTNCFNGNLTSCPTKCQLGEFSSQGVLPCLLCPVGTYSNITTSIICSPCPSGTITNKTGTIDCLPCLAGEYSSNTTNCLNCKPGAYSDKGAGNCTLCPVGTYQPNSGSIKCLVCDNSFIEGLSYCPECDIWHMHFINDTSCTKLSELSYGLIGLGCLITVSVIYVLLHWKRKANYKSIQ